MYYFSENHFAMKSFLTIAFVFALALGSPMNAQVIPLADIQGQTDVSPYENQSVSVSGKVTEAIGFVSSSSEKA
jgi:hypothetical protein